MWQSSASLLQINCSPGLLQPFVYSGLLQSLNLFQRNLQLLFALDTVERKICGESGNRLRASRHVLATAALANIFPLEVGVADGYAHDTVKVMTEPKYQKACF